MTVPVIACRAVVSDSALAGRALAASGTRNRRLASPDTRICKRRISHSSKSETSRRRDRARGAAHGQKTARDYSALGIEESQTDAGGARPNRCELRTEHGATRAARRGLHRSGDGTAGCGAMTNAIGLWKRTKQSAHRPLSRLTAAGVAYFSADGKGWKCAAPAVCASKRTTARNAAAPRVHRHRPI